MAKKYSEQTLIGQRGINLIESRVLQMGWVWNSTHIEAGIDGYIEIRDPGTGRATNSIIQVQSKATSRQFANETDSSFEFGVTEKDLDYWLSGNAPVILICSRPETDEAYWVDLKTYFQSPSQHRTRRILFNKRTDRFDTAARERLHAVAAARARGLYLSPPPRTETLFTNLLPLTRLAEHVYVGSTELSDPREVRRVLGWGSSAPDAWVYRRKRVLSFDDLSRDIWRDIIDPGTVEAFAAQHWADSEDAERRNDFIELLTRALRAKLRLDSIVYHRDGEYFYFMAPATANVRKFEYASLRRNAERTVVQAFPGKKNPNHIQFFRHAAFKPAFTRFGGRWYLVITPTYHFTSDGWRPYPFYESKLKGIKGLEKNSAVLGQVVMWASLLKDRPEQLFETTRSSFIGFSDLASAPIAAGLNEEWWLTNEEDAVTRGSAASRDSLFPVDGGSQ